MMARGDSLMCSRNPGSNYKSGLIAPKRIPTSVPTTRQQNSKSFMRCRSGKARWRTTRKVANVGQTEEERPQQRQPDTERYLLQIDRQTKRSFKTPEAVQAMALEIKARFPALQVSIYDSVTKSRTLVDVPKSG